MACSQKLPSCAVANLSCYCSITGGGKLLPASHEACYEGINMEQLVQLHIAFDAVFKKGSRSHVTTNDPSVKYVIRWFPEEGISAFVPGGG